MPLIEVDGLVRFNGTGDILVNRSAANADPDRLLAALRKAFEHVDDPVLVHAGCGRRGPLANYFKLSFEVYLQLKADAEVRFAAERGKRLHTARRRQEFNCDRDRLALEMIEAGVPYICAVEECGAVADLTVDHIKPLSRGGGDELSNLRFLCRSHNSSKGDRLQ